MSIVPRQDVSTLGRFLSNMNLISSVQKFHDENIVDVPPTIVEEPETESVSDIGHCISLIEDYQQSSPTATTIVSTPQEKLTSLKSIISSFESRLSNIETILNTQASNITEFHDMIGDLADEVDIINQALFAEVDEEH